MEEKVRYGWVYGVRNIINRDLYIGKTIDLKRRIDDHFNGRSNIHLVRAIKEYGEENFKIEIFYEKVPEWMLSDLEMRTIATLNTFHGRGYNHSPGGEGGGSGFDSPSSNKKVLKNIDTIIKDYQSGIPLSEMAPKYDATSHVLRSWLRKFGVDTSRFFRDDLRKYSQEIIDLYRSGKSRPFLAKKYKCSQQAIKTILEENEEPIRSRLESKFTDPRYRKDLRDNSKEIVDLYLSGKSTTVIGKMFNSSADPIKLILKENNIPLRPAKRRRIDIESRYQEIIQRYQDGESIRKIASSLKCSNGLISKILKQYNVPIRSSHDRVRIKPFTQLSFLP